MSNPGWYPQPDGQERYFDGEGWTEHHRPAQAPGAPPPGSPQNMPPGQPQKKSGALKWVLIIGAVVLLLCFGGFAACTAGVIGSADEVVKSIESDMSESGGPDVAVPVTEGEAFEVRGFDYAEGWKIGEELDMVEITGLKVTNNREDADSAIVELKFMSGSEIVASVDCTSDTLQPGQTATLTCFSGDPMPEDYDEITINDTF